MREEFTVDISENNGILEYKLEVPSYHRKFYNNKIYINSRAVTDHLVRQGYKIKSCIDGATISNNSSNDNSCKGVWKFKLEEPPTAPKVRKITKPRTTKKTKE
jgi:hypothetical protein